MDIFREIIRWTEKLIEIKTAKYRYQDQWMDNEKDIKENRQTDRYIDREIHEWVKIG